MLIFNGEIRMKNSDKEKIIQDVAKDARSYINDGTGGQLWLDAILKDGFIGFKHMSDEDLKLWARRYQCKISDD